MEQQAPVPLTVPLPLLPRPPLHQPGLVPCRALPPVVVAWRRCRMNQPAASTGNQREPLTSCQCELMMSWFGWLVPLMNCPFNKA